MASLQKTLMAKFNEAEQLARDIRQMETDSEEQKASIYRWAVVGDETERLMIQAEEQLPSAQLSRLKAEVNGKGSRDLWAKYREAEWRIPKFGGPGPGDPPPPRINLRDLLQ